jgi:hypothetical protein
MLMDSRINILKMATLLKAIYMFCAITITISLIFFIEIKKSTLKFIWKHKRPQRAKAILSKKSNGGGITIPNFKLYYKAIAIKNSMVLTQKPMEQNRRPRQNPHSPSHLIFDKRPQNISWRKK